jgi:hypothetical protein
MSDFPVRQQPDAIDAPRVVRATLGSAGVALVGVAVATRILLAQVGAFAPDARGPGGAVAPPRPEIGTIEQTLDDVARRGPDLEARQRRELERWGWVDRNDGIAVIPIDRAMDIVAARGSR